MPKFKYELDFNIADHDRWAAHRLGIKDEWGVWTLEDKEKK